MHYTPPHCWYLIATRTSAQPECEDTPIISDSDTNDSDLQDIRDIINDLCNTTATPYIEIDQIRMKNHQNKLSAHTADHQTSEELVHNDQINVADDITQP